MSTRREHDLLGDRDVPMEAYYGVHTLRAVENFPITGTPISIYPDLIAALASIKLAAAKSNRELGLLDAKLMASIATMAEAYGMHVLGAVEKPMTPEKLVRLIGLHEQRAEPAQPSAVPQFALDELLDGLRNDQFEPWFQPKVELSSGRVCGAEAQSSCTPTA